MTDGKEMPSPVYANVVRMTTGPFDLVMDFGFQSPEQMGQGAETFEPSVRIAMSLAHAKSMLPLLASVIAEYEEQVGHITAPGFDDSPKE